MLDLISDLLTNNMIFPLLFSRIFSNSESCFFKSWVESKMNNIILDSLAISNDFFIPKLSILSLVFLIPAVSINLNLKPPIFTSSSIASLVVPAISDTIAFSSLTKQFNKVDFPTLGVPRIATGMPFLITLPKLNDLTSFFNSIFISFNSF